MKLKLGATFLLAFAPVIGAQRSTPDVSKTLTAFEQRWVTALAKADVATLNSILADSYADTDEEGNQGTRQDVIAVLKSGDLKIASITLSGMTAHPYGNAAVVTGTAVQKGAYREHPLTSRVRFTDTFIERDGRWRVVASQRSPVAGK